MTIIFIIMFEISSLSSFLKKNKELQTTCFKVQFTSGSSEGFFVCLFVCLYFGSMWDGFSTRDETGVSQ